MSKSLDRFNLTVLCQYHSKKCNLLCCFSGCRQRALCSDCFPTHDFTHLSSIVPLDSKSHFTPNLFTKQILEIESDIVILQDKIKKEQDALYKELDKFLNEIQENVSKKIINFRRKIVQFTEEFNEYYDQVFLKFLHVLRHEYTEVDNIIKMDQEYFSSDRVQKLLIKQHALENEIIPTLKKQAQYVRHELKKRYIKLQKNDIFSMIDEKFNEMFHVNSFIVCNKPPKNFTLESVTSRNEKNEIQKFFTSSLKNDYAAKQNVDIFTYSENFPLPNFKDGSSVKTPISYSNCLPRHFELSSHKEIIKSLINLNDGESFASGSADNIIKIWDLTTCNLKSEIQTYHKEMHAICYLNDLNYIITAGKDMNIRIWDLYNSKCRKIIKEAHSNTIYCLLYLRDKSSFVSGSADKLIKMWEISTGKLLFIFQGHENTIKSFCFLNGIYCFASGGSDALIKIWDLTQNQCKQTLSGHDSPIYCMEYYANKKLLFSGGHDKKIRIWEVFEEGFMKTLEGHNDGVFCLKLVNFDKNLISCGGDFLIKIWDFMNEECVLVLKGHQEIVSSVIAMKNDILISGGWDHKILLWKL